MTEGGAAFESRCPRCGGEFHCGMNQPRPCACASLDLDSALLARLRESYDGCLCTTCLAQLRAPASTSK